MEVGHYPAPEKDPKTTNSQVLRAQSEAVSHHISQGELTSIRPEHDGILGHVVLTFEKVEEQVPCLHVDVAGISSTARSFQLVDLR